MNNSAMLPIFPLGIFSIPNEEFVLHVFEEKYKLLVKDVLSKQKQFLIPFVLNGEQQKYGNLAEIIKVDNVADNGEMDIRVKSIGIVEVTGIKQGVDENDYSMSTFDVMNIESKKPSEKLLTLYTQYLTLKNKDSIQSINFQDIDVFKIATETNAPSYQKYNLIDGETSDAFERNLTNFLLLQVQIETMTREMGPKFVLN